MKKYKYIFTDLDGTLYKIYPEEFTVLYKKNFIYFLAEKGLDPVIADYLIEAFYIMRKIDGTRPVKDLFFEYLVPKSNMGEDKWKDLLTEFYNSEYYRDIKKVSSVNPVMKDVIKALKEKGYKIFLTTNPVFYRLALEKRLEWAEIDKNNFEFITSMETMHYTKPYKEYFDEVVKKYNLNPSDILMIGNDTYDDTACETIGIDCYIVTDSIINASGKPISTKYYSDSKTLLELIKNEF